MRGALPIEWRVRRVPLAPCGVVGLGRAARRLAERVLDDGAPIDLQGVAGVDLICVLGAAEQLPWVDGVVYLGVDSRAPALLHPCAWEPIVSPDLVHRALSPSGSRTAVLIDPTCVFSLTRARAVDRDRLAAWLGGAA